MAMTWKREHPEKWSVYKSCVNGVQSSPIKIMIHIAAARTNKETVPWQPSMLDLLVINEHTIHNYTACQRDMKLQTCPRASGKEWHALKKLLH